MKRHWKIRLKERTSGHICTPEYEGELDLDGIIEFFGLEKNDVEWYEIKEVPYNENKQSTHKNKAI